MITSNINRESDIVRIVHRNQVRIKRAADAAQSIRRRVMRLPMAAQTDIERSISRDVIDLSRIVDEICAMECDYRTLPTPKGSGSQDEYSFWTIYMNDGRRIVVAGRNYVEAYSTRCTKEDTDNVVTIEPGVTRRHWSSKKREWICR